MQSDNDNELPRTRAEAKAIGSKRYFTGKPCKYGHVAERWTGDGQCYECARAKALRKYLDNREERNAHNNEYAKERYANDPEYRARCKAYQKSLRKDPVTNAKKVAYGHKRRAERTDQERERDRTYAREYQRALKRKSPKARLNSAISGGIHKSITAGSKRRRPWESLVGYTAEELMEYLEKQFTNGMTWENYGKGGWHIDHVIPKAAHNYTTPEDIDFKRCWALKNLQPLWATDNHKKHAKLSKPFQPSLALAVNDNIQKEIKHG